MADKFPDLKIKIPAENLKKEIPKPFFSMYALHYISTTGSLSAPCLDIQGILLYPDAPADTFEYFRSKGAIIDIIDDNGKKRVKLHGNFTSTLEEAQKFLAEQRLKAEIPAEAEKKSSADRADSKESKETAEAVNFQKQVKARLASMKKSLLPKALSLRFAYDNIVEEMVENELGVPEPVTQRNELFSLVPTALSALEGSINCQAKGIHLEGAKMTCKDELILNSMGKLVITADPKNIILESDSTTQQTIGTGMLNDVVSGGNATLHAGTQMVLKNAVFLSGGEIDLFCSGGDVNLTFDHGPAWLNSPIIPSLVFSYNSNINGQHVANTAAVSATTSASASVPASLDANTVAKPKS